MGVKQQSLTHSASRLIADIFPVEIIKYPFPLAAFANIGITGLTINEYTDAMLHRSIVSLVVFMSSSYCPGLCSSLLFYLCAITDRSIYGRNSDEETP